MITKTHKGCQSIYDAAGSQVFAGEWDARQIFDVISNEEPGFWRGKSVLEMAGNTGGLSVEIARHGGIVTMTEPDPYRNNLALSRTSLCRAEGLSLAIKPDDFFECRDLPRHDVIICLGLIYHFRHPQLMLDILSSMRPEFLFVSTQTHPGTDLVMTNRKGVLPAKFFKDSMPLTGWHPTRPLFERMLRWAGFDDIISLTGENFPNKQVGLTNSAYYRARCVGPIDPEGEARTYYPR